MSIKDTSIVGVRIRKKWLYLAWSIFAMSANYKDWSMVAETMND